jgi:hypothetical protein
LITGDAEELRHAMRFLEAKPEPAVVMKKKKVTSRS